MNPSSGLSFRPPPSSSSPSPSSLMDKFLGLSLSPASVHSLSSDTSATDANDLDDLDEQEIWDVENEIEKVPPPSSPAFSAPLPPRIHFSRRNLGTPESRSPLGDAASASVSSIASPSFNSIGGIAGMLQGISPVSSSNGGSRSPVGRVWPGEAMARRTTSASRMIPRMTPHNHTQDSETRGKQAASRMMIPQSAPLNIPDWSKIRHGRKQRLGRDWRHRRNEAFSIGDDDEEEGDDVQDEAEGRLPPHELLARQYAKSERSTSSVLEGAGRTLKGRDLSRVRNEVLTYTGFVE